MSTPHYTFLQCVRPRCAARFPASRATFLCDHCGELLDVAYDWDAAHRATGFARATSLFAARLTDAAHHAAGSPAARLNASGVWRFRELLPFYEREEQIVTLAEGRTTLQRADLLARAVGFDEHTLFLQYEGFNPSGSFKDNGMAAAFTHARIVGASRVIGASTGNTSASLALYAAAAPELRAFVLIGKGKIAFGKLSQALDFGATTLQLDGDFDACLHRIQQLASERPELGLYIMNSINPFRLEGQKTIIFRVLEALAWNPPEWIVVPGGNLGNTSAFGKALAELKALGLISRLPRLAVINAQGADTLHRLYNHHAVRWRNGNFDTHAINEEYERMRRQGVRAHTIASAIEIAKPVNLPKALRALEYTDGVVRAVSDHDILENKALIARFGFGCEPACAASLAGARALRQEGIIRKSDRVVCILTGHALKDPDATVRYHTDAAQSADPARRYANPPIPVPDDLEALVRAMQ